MGCGFLLRAESFCWWLILFSNIDRLPRDGARQEERGLSSRISTVIKSD
jgi:hypothetical protein